MINIIPNIEKNPKIILFAQTLFGKITISFIFGFILWFVANDFFLIWPILVFLFSFTKNKRLWAIIVVNTIFWFLFDGFFQVKTTFNIGNKKGYTHLLDHLIDFFHIHVPEVISLRMFYILITIIGMTFILLSIKVYLRFFYKWPAVVYLSFITIPILFLVRLQEQSSLFFLIYSGILIIALKSFWFIAFSMDDLKFQGETRNLKLFLGSFFPFWLQGFLISPRAIPRGFSELSSNATSNPEELAICQIKGLKLALWAAMSLIASVCVRLLVFGGKSNYPIFLLFELKTFNLPLPFDVPQYNQLNVSLFEKWLTLLILPWVYITWQLVGELGLLIAFLRLLGFRIKRAVYKPHLATNFNQFFQRIYFYYGSILVQFFLFPLSRFLRHWRLPRRLHLFSCIFLSVLIGGLFLEYTINAQHILTFGPFETLKMTFNRTLYFAGIGFASGISAIRTKRQKSSPNENKFHPLRFLTIYVIYSFFFFLQGFINYGSTWNRVILMFSLFGINLT